MKLRPESIDKLPGLLYGHIHDVLTLLGEVEAADNHKYVLSLVKGATAVAKASNRPPPTEEQHVKVTGHTNEPLCIGVSVVDGKTTKCRNYAKYGPHCNYHMLKRERGYIR